MTLSDKIKQLFRGRRSEGAPASSAVTTGAGPAARPEAPVPAAAPAPPAAASSPGAPASSLPPPSPAKRAPEATPGLGADLDGDSGEPIIELQPVASEERLRMIEETAYFRAEERGFASGDPARDWAEAEAHVDALIAAAGRRVETQ